MLLLAFVTEILNTKDWCSEAAKYNLSLLHDSEMPLAVLFVARESLGIFSLARFLQVERISVTNSKSPSADPSPAPKPI
jgi:hypothetical protein